MVAMEVAIINSTSSKAMVAITREVAMEAPEATIITLLQEATMECLLLTRDMTIITITKGTISHPNQLMEATHPQLTIPTPCSNHTTHLHQYMLLLMANNSLQERPLLFPSLICLQLILS